jgi:Ni/Co efflux regulator RcnB
MLRIVLAVVLALSAALATLDGAAQSGKRQDGGRERQMSQEERQRMRDDVRDAYRQRQDRPQKARQQQMSPEERGRLRRDIEDANKNLKR